MAGTPVKQNCLRKQNEGKASFCSGPTGIITDFEERCLIAFFIGLNTLLSFTLLDRFHSFGLSAWVMGSCCPQRTKSWGPHTYLRLLSLEEIFHRSPTSLGPSIWIRPVVKLSGPDPSLLAICLTLPDFRHTDSRGLLEAIQHLG